LCGHPLFISNRATADLFHLRPFGAVILSRCCQKPGARSAAQSCILWKRSGAADVRKHRKEVYKMKLQQNCPCDHCKSVRDPGSCENKRCQKWSNWFLKRWSLIHGFYNKHNPDRESHP